MHLLADGHLQSTLLVDDHFVPFLAAHHWLWKRTIDRAYHYTESKKQKYLSTFIAEHFANGRIVKQVRFKNGPHDYRLCALDIFYEVPQCKEQRAQQA